MSKKFILLTSGRAGSTSLINALSRHDDIVLPSKQIECVDNELFHPKYIGKYSSFYEKLSGRCVNDELSLINAYYDSTSGYAFSGFKSMPNRHKYLDKIAESGDIKLITLIREDIASTVASFLMAIDHNAWRRSGGKQKHRFVFGSKYEARAVSHLAYILDAIAQFEALPNCIRLTFENICKSDYSHDELNEYFGRKVALDNPRPPVSAKSYVNNWNDYSAFIEEKVIELKGRLR